MRIVDHKLVDVDYHESPNTDRRVRSHDYLVMHYTGGGYLDALNWMSASTSGVSAHILIGRDGQLVQLVPFDMRAWHAGDSEYGPRKWLNNYSIGIELEGDGNVLLRDGHWQSQWSSQTYEPGEVIEARHQHWPDSQPAAGWLIYTPEQLAKAAEVGRCVVAEYDIGEVLGHDDISPGRKVDPGPAFPMTQYRGRVFGRKGE